MRVVIFLLLDVQERNDSFLFSLNEFSLLSNVPVHHRSNIQIVRV